MGKWFEVSLRMTKTMEDGTLKGVTELWMIDALTFAEAEERGMEETQDVQQREVTAIKRSPVAEIHRSDRETDDCWWRVKVNLVTLDENSGKERKTAVHMLVEAGSAERVNERLKDIMRGTVSDWETASVVQSRVAGVSEYVGQAGEA